MHFFLYKIRIQLGFAVWKYNFSRNGKNGNWVYLVKCEGGWN